MSLGMRAMTANYSALQATSHNISNANTAGYSRQSAQFETAGGQFSGAGFFGRGVNVSGVTRAHSDFLTREAAATRSMAASDEALSTQLQMLEKIFGTGEDGLGHAAGELFNAFVDVANKPTDASARQVVLARANELASRFRSAGEQFDVLQAGVTQDLKAAVASVNELSRQIATLNQRIAAVRGTGQTPNDLLDERDQAINELSRYVQVTTVGADDGSTSVFLGGGQRLVLGTEVTKLATMADAYDPAKVGLGVIDNGTVARPLADSLVTGGSLSGLLRFQNHDLVDARNLVGQMAAAVSGSVNEQQALGLDLRQPAGSGAPLFSVGALRVAPATGNSAINGIPVASTIDASGERVPSVSLTTVDASELMASDYELVADPNLPGGSYQLTRLSDGQAWTVADGSEIDGFRIGVTSPPPLPGDRFLLQPVGTAASRMQAVLADPKGLAAASPVSATLGVGNAGTATVAALRAADSSLNPNLVATLSFTDDNGGYTWTLVDSTGALPPSSGSGTWSAGQAIELNGWELRLDGVPKGPAGSTPGDSIVIARTESPASNNGNANALLALRDRGLVGQRTLADGSVVPGDTVTDAYAGMLADIGVRVQSAASSAELSATMAAEAQAAEAEKSGVNLDEEAARLIQFQQSYQAAAKMLQVAQSLFDTLLQTAGR